MIVGTRMREIFLLTNSMATEVCIVGQTAQNTKGPGKMARGTG